MSSIRVIIIVVSSTPLVLAGLLVVAGCCSNEDWRRYVDMRTLIRLLKTSSGLYRDFTHSSHPHDSSTWPSPRLFWSTLV